MNYLTDYRKYLLLIAAICFTVIAYIDFDWLLKQIGFQLYGILIQVIVLVYYFKKNHEQEMLEKKYNGEATFSTMISRFVKGRQVEIFYIAFVTAIGTLGLHIPIVYDNIPKIFVLLNQFIPSIPLIEIDTNFVDAFIIIFITYFNWKKKLDVMVKFDNDPERVSLRKSNDTLNLNREI